MNILIWVLWALKLAGLTSISYNFLGWLTLCGIVLAVLVYFLKQKTAQRELEQVADKLKDDGDFTNLAAIVMMIYKKMK